MRPPRSALLIVAVLIALPVLAPVGSGAPPPEGVCGVCGPSFERSASEAGVDVTVAESSLTVDVISDSDGRWTATVSLDRTAADRFAANRTLLARTIERTYDSSRTVVDAPRNLSVALDEQTLTVTFTVEDVVHESPGGIVLFDGFVHHPPNGEPYLDADTVTVSGPPGTTVTHTPPGGTITGNRSVWTASEGGRTASPHLGREAFIAFAPDDSIVAEATTAAAVRGHALGLIRTELRAYALIPAILLGLVAAGLLCTGDRLFNRASLDRTPIRWIAGGCGIYVVLTALGYLVSGDDFAFILGVVGIGLAPQTLLTATVVALTAHLDVDPGGNSVRIAAVVVLGWTLALVLGAPASALLVLALGPLIFLPFGTLAGSGHRARFVFPVVAALGAVVAALPFVPRVGVVFVSPVMLAMLLSGTALLGIPLFAIGWRIGSEATSSVETPNGTDR